MGAVILQPHSLNNPFDQYRVVEFRDVVDGERSPRVLTAFDTYPEAESFRDEMNGPTQVSTRRRICWPDPDAICLVGGCIHCNDNRFRSIVFIERYAKRKGLTEAFMDGKRNDWYNAESK